MEAQRIWVVLREQDGMQRAMSHWLSKEEAEADLKELVKRMRKEGLRLRKDKWGAYKVAHRDERYTVGWVELNVPAYREYSHIDPVYRDEEE